MAEQSVVGLGLEEQKELEEERLVAEELAMSESEFGGEVGDSEYAPSEYGEVPVAAGAVLHGRERLRSVVGEVLVPSAVAAQRLSASSSFRVFTRGRCHSDHNFEQVEPLPQCFFSVSGFVSLTSYADDAFYARFKEGRVVTRMSLETSGGKTTRVPAEIAKRCGLRVCQLELDATVARLAFVRQRELYAVDGSSRRWIRERRPYLSVMSYDDFRGIVCSRGRDRFFSDFDVFYFDEAHEPVASVWLAKQYFARYATEQNSLVIASATVSTVSENNAVASRVGRFSDLGRPYGLSEFLETDMPEVQFLHDRTLFVVASDAAVYVARAHYVELGVRVMMLDSGSVYADVGAVNEFLRGDSAVPRVVISHCLYGTSYNLAVSYVITTGTEVRYDFTPEATVVETEHYVRPVVLTQHKGRSGRGMVVGSGGLVLSGERCDAAVTELHASEAPKAYLGLIAASIRPRPGRFSAVERLFPRGVSRDTAQMILSVNLPPVLVARYLGADGLFAARFCAGLSLFAQPDQVFIPSADVDPVGYASWLRESVGGYYPGQEQVGDPFVCVPFESPPSLRVSMHTVYAVAQGLMEIPRFVPRGGGDDASGDERVVVAPRRRLVAPLRVVPDEKPLPEVPVQKPAWEYDVPEVQQARRERRRSLQWRTTVYGKAAMASMVAAVDAGLSVGTMPSVPGVQLSEKDVVVPVTRLVDVSSPGGSVAFRFAASTYAGLVSGRRMVEGVFEDLLLCVKGQVGRFVTSELFDNWSPAWLAVLRTCGVESLVRHVRDRGLQTTLVKLLAYMYDRFRAEALTVCQESNLYRSKVSRVFGGNKVSLGKLSKYVRQGRLPVAQSDVFISTLLDVKEKYDAALVTLESVGLFAPALVRGAQARLPLRDRGRRTSVTNAEVVSPLRGRFGF